MGKSFSLNKKIASLIYKYNTKILDTGFGPALYLIDLSQSETKTLVGASWQRARDSDGNIKEHYCRLCPNWSANLIDAWKLVEYCNQANSGINWEKLDKMLSDWVLFGHSPESMALTICQTVLYIVSK